MSEIIKGKTILNKDGEIVGLEFTELASRAEVKLMGYEIKDLPTTLNN